MARALLNGMLPLRSAGLVSPNVAVERGPAKVIRPGQTPEESGYTAVSVKRNGRWYLDRVTEENVPVLMSHHEQLEELNWMIGAWVDRSSEPRQKYKPKLTFRRDCHSSDSGRLRPMPGPPANHIFSPAIQST